MFSVVLTYLRSSRVDGENSFLEVPNKGVKDKCPNNHDHAHDAEVWWCLCIGKGENYEPHNKHNCWNVFEKWVSPPEARYKCTHYHYWQYLHKKHYQFNDVRNTLQKHNISISYLRGALYIWESVTTEIISHWWKLLRSSNFTLH